MNIKIEEKIEKNINNKINDMGFDIEYVEFVKEGNNNILRIVLDKLNGIVNIDDCEKVSREVEDDVDKLLTKEYVLEVSSPGLERQLKNIKLYKKYIGKNIFVKLYKKGEYGKEINGILENVNEDEKSINVKLDNLEIIKLSIENIASANTVYNFDEEFDKKDSMNLNKLNKFNKKGN